MNAIIATMALMERVGLVGVNIQLKRILLVATILTSVRREQTIVMQTQSVPTRMAGSNANVRMATLEMGETVETLTSVRREQTTVMQTQSVPIQKAGSNVNVKRDILGMERLVEILERYVIVIFACKSVMNGVQLTHALIVHRIVKAGRKICTDVALSRVKQDHYRSRNAMLSMVRDLVCIPTLLSHALLLVLYMSLCALQHGESLGTFAVILQRQVMAGQGIIFIMIQLRTLRNVCNRVRLVESEAAVNIEIAVKFVFSK